MLSNVAGTLTGMACDSACRDATGWGSACGYDGGAGECCCRGFTGCYLASTWETGGYDRCRS